MHTTFEDYFNNKYDKPTTDGKEPEESDTSQDSSETSPEDSGDDSSGSSSETEDEKTDEKTPSPYTAGTYYDSNIVDNQ